MWIKKKTTKTKSLTTTNQPKNKQTNKTKTILVRQIWAMGGLNFLRGQSALGKCPPVNMLFASLYHEVYRDKFDLLLPSSDVTPINSGTCSNELGSLTSTSSKRTAIFSLCRTFSAPT